MPSAIDITKPIYGTPTTQSVRDNFHLARDEITELQNRSDSFVSRTGDTMTGALLLHGDPQANNEATTLAWVLRQLGSTVNTLIYVGEYDGATDVILSSNQAQFVVGTALPPATAQTSQFYFTIKTSHSPPGVGNQPPEGVTAGTFLLSNGIKWINYAMTAANVTAKTTPIDDPPITNVPGSNVYDALAGIGQNFLLKTGGTLTDFLTLHAAPTANFHASTKKYVDDKVAALTFPGEAPTDSFAYARASSSWVKTPRFGNTLLDTDSGLTLRLNSSSASGMSNAIIGQKSNVYRWLISLGDGTPGHNFAISRFNDAGTNLDPYFTFHINRSNALITTTGSLYFDIPVNNYPNIWGRGANNPTDPAMDTLNITARFGITSSTFALRGPTFTDSPNGVDFYAGANYAKRWAFRQNGVATFPGPLHLPNNAAVYFNPNGLAFIFQDAASNLVLQTANEWRMYWNAADGSWLWQGYPNFMTYMHLFPSGQLWTKGGLSTDATIYSGGVLTANGGITTPQAIYAGTSINVDNIMSRAGYFFVASNTLYYLNRSMADGHWRFVENNVVTCTIQTDGVVMPTSHMFARGNVYASGDWNYYLGTSGSIRLLNFAAQWSIQWESANGILSWNTTSGNFWVWRCTDWWVYNQFGVVAGHGWVDLSDERTKENIEPSEKGLIELLQLNPVSYKRVSRAETTRPAQTELGFTAQDVMKVLPDAVYDTGIELDKESGATALGIMTSNVLALAVNAIKQLTARVVSLEATLTARSN